MHIKAKASHFFYAKNLKIVEIKKKTFVYHLRVLSNYNDESPVPVTTSVWSELQFAPMVCNGAKRKLFQGFKVICLV